MSWTFSQHLLNGLGQVLDMRWAGVGHVVDTCWTYVGHVLDMFGGCLGDVWGMAWVCLWVVCGPWGLLGPSDMKNGRSPHMGIKKRLLDSIQMIVFCTIEHLKPQ